MKRFSVITSSDGGRQEIDYAALPDTEIEHRIAAYERKYGASLPEYSKTFACDSANAFEVFDIMDWETLVEERDERKEAYLKARP
jgi:hypothetical protein